MESSEKQPIREQWEYRVEWRSDTGMYYDRFFEDVLKPLGREGWELVHLFEFVYPANQMSERHIKGYFKRRLEVKHAQVD